MKRYNPTDLSCASDVKKARNKGVQSPEPSFVSLKSKASIGVPPDLCPESRSGICCISMKSEASIGVRPDLSAESINRGDKMETINSSNLLLGSVKKCSQNSESESTKLTDYGSINRPDSPEPSCVSMKSEASMDLPPKLSDDSEFRGKSPEPSLVSIKTKALMQLRLDIGHHAGLGAKPLVFTAGLQDNPSFIDDLTAISVFRSDLKKKFECVSEGTSQQRKLLKEIYTDLYITENERGDITQEHEVRRIETQSRPSTDTAIRCCEIFKPLPAQDKPIRTVLTKGVAGIGKTVSVQKFIVDWTECKENQDIHLVFPLPFRELNLMKDKEISLSDLLLLFFPQTTGITVWSNQYKVLFIFDGLDECRLSLDFPCDQKLCDVTKSAPVNVLLSNLLKGNLLPSALIWITSRPAAADLLPRDCVHRVTEVRGFSDPQKEEYFRNRVKDGRLCDRIISHLKSRSLFIMCHIPVFCWISATVLETMLSESGSSEIPKTLTQMYTHFLIIQTNITQTKHYEKKQKGDEMILKLGRLAFHQLQKGNLIFYEEDLRECGIGVTQASVYSGLCTQIFREELGLYQGKVFCFVHLSLQEHLAALYVHFSFANNSINEFDGTDQSLNAGIVQTDLSDLHQRAVDETLQSPNGHLDLFLRFLLGLSLESNQMLLEDLLTCAGHESYSKEKTVEYIKKKIAEELLPGKYLNLFHSLVELGDDSLIREAQENNKPGPKIRLSSSQWSALVFVLLSSEHLEEFDFGNIIRRFCDFSCTTSDEVLVKMLPVVKASKSVLLWDCGLTDEGCSALTSVLTSKCSRLKLLNLSRNNLRDSGVKILCDGLKDSHCKLEELKLISCGVTDEGCSALTLALTSSSSQLKLLDLSRNNLSDSAVKILCDFQKNPGYKLEYMHY